MKQFADVVQDAQEGSFGSTYIATRSIKSKHLCMAVSSDLLLYARADTSSLHLPRGP